MLDAIGAALAAFATDHPLISIIVICIGAMDYVQWVYGKFVTFTHRMRLHYRRMRSEPSAHLVDN